MLEARALLNTGHPDLAYKAAEEALHLGGRSGDVFVQISALIELATEGNMEGHPNVFNDAWREQNTHTTISRLLQRLVVDKWDRDKAFAEAIDVLNKIYGKYA